MAKIARAVATAAALQIAELAPRFSEQLVRRRDVGRLKRHVLGIPNDFRPDVDQSQRVSGSMAKRSASFTSS